MFFDKDKMAQAIVARQEKPAEEAAEVSGLETAAEEILSAIEAKDVKALAAVLSAFDELNDSMEEMEEPKEEEPKILG